jgi:hypothetical protein
VLFDELNNLNLDKWNIFKDKWTILNFSDSILDSRTDLKYP